MCGFQTKACSGETDMKVRYEGDNVPICIECKSFLESEGVILPRSDMPAEMPRQPFQASNEPGHGFPGGVK